MDISIGMRHNSVNEKSWRSAIVVFCKSCISLIIFIIIVVVVIVVIFCYLYYYYYYYEDDDDDDNNNNSNNESTRSSETDRDAFSGATGWTQFFKLPSMCHQMEQAVHHDHVLNKRLVDEEQGDTL